jgi:hypothetical protein
LALIRRFPAGRRGPFQHTCKRSVKIRKACNPNDFPPSKSL